ncbi:MAG TPA: GGDEF domain-containing phosphodiesterase [Albitalea sp.]|nr:GGDEF domain-containing phosphodiesterase [Albitalea sp.]
MNSIVDTDVVAVPARDDAFTVAWLNPPVGALGKTMAAIALGLSMLAIAMLVRVSGGTGMGLPNLFYFPILLAASVFGTSGGAVAGLACGLLMGPQMPLNVAADQHQSLLTWSVRLTTYVAVGAFSGLLISLIKQRHAQLRWLAFHNLNTGLPNHAALLREIRQVMPLPRQRAASARGRARAQAANQRLLLLKIQNYDQIINTLGPQISDPLVRSLAARLADLYGTTGPADVFDLRAQRLAMLLSGAANDRSMQDVHLKELPTRPVFVEGIPVYVDVVAGTAEVDPGPQSAELVVQRANIALCEASRLDRFHVSYGSEIERPRKRNLELLARLPQAMKADELFVDYQPKVDLRSGDVIGAEALVRWRHPSFGRIAPADFIPLVEGSALIHPLTRFVFTRAVGHFARLRCHGTRCSVAVNLSARNLSDPELFDDLFDIAEASDLAPRFIELEITESAVLQVPARLKDALIELRRRGMKVSIDDFGTGYTSLGYLVDLPVDGIKIDQVFVRKLLEDRSTRHIVKAMIDMAKNLGLFTVAEGIEDRATADALAEMGCDIGQGYWFSRPLAQEDFDRWLAERATALT